MSDQDRIEAIAAEAIAWRRHIHQIPELLFDLPKTSAFVAEKLRTFGCDEVVTGIAKSGVVGVIQGKYGPGRSIALRSDMDALSISEQTNLPYASIIQGRMHACGHDGHTAMLLAAACCLARTRDFAGTVVLIFQPAEEGGAGGRVMIEEGILERFGIEEVFGMHNVPGLSVGSFAIRPGAFMAAGDRFVVTFRARGGHAAEPHKTSDPVLAVAHAVSALQSIAARYTSPFEPVVVSVTYLSAGSTGTLNVIPSSVQFGGTIRTLAPAIRDEVEGRFRDIIAATARMFVVEAEIDWQPGYPVAINDLQMTREAIGAAHAVSGSERVDDDYPCVMGSEDFSYMLEKRPGALIWIGNGNSAGLHHPAYDFNDNAIVHGVRYWTALVGRRLRKGETLSG